MLVVRRATCTAAWAVAIAASAVATAAASAASEDGLEGVWWVTGSCGFVDRLKPHLRFSVFCGENKKGVIIR